MSSSTELQTEFKSKGKSLHKSKKLIKQMLLLRLVVQYVTVIGNTGKGTKRVRITGKPKTDPEIEDKNSK